MWGAIASAIAGPLLGGLFGKQSADSGVNAQAAAAAQSNATQKAMYDQTRADNAPTLERSNAAGNKLSQLMGLSGTGRTNSFTPKTMEQLRGEMRGQFTSGGGSSMGGSSGIRLAAGTSHPSSLINDMFRGPGGYANVYDPGRYDAESGNTYGNGFKQEWQPTQSTVDESGFNTAVQNAFDAQGPAREGEVDPEHGSLMRQFGEAAPEFRRFGEAEPDGRMYEGGTPGFDMTGKKAPGQRITGEAAPELRQFGEAAPEMRKFGEADWKNDFVAQNGMQFGLDEGRKGVERQQSASGGMLSGATLKALARFGTDYGTKNTAGAYDRFNSEQTQGYGRYVDKYNRFNTEQDQGYSRWTDKRDRFNQDQAQGYSRYVDKYNRFNTDQNTKFNRLSGIAGTGQTAINQVGASGQNYANSVSQTTQGMGNARAAAGIAGSNALSNGFQGAFDNYQQGQQLNAFQNRRRGGSGIRQQSVYGGGNAFSDTGDY